MSRLPAGVEISRRASFDTDTGGGEFVVRLDGLDTNDDLELFKSFFTGGRHQQDLVAEG